MANDFIKLEDAIALTDQHCFESIYDAEWMEEALRDLPTADVVGKEEWDKLMFLVEEANKVLESAPKWISVKERLPEKGISVLCACRANIFCVMKWDGIDWFENPTHVYMSGFVTHWMPLPEPPKEGGGEEE